MNDPTTFERCLSFRVRGPWAHFRRVEGNSVKNTYRVMPRTTAAGLIAAMLGEPRNSYYETFERDASAMAITPEKVRTMNMPELSLKTTGDEKRSIGNNRKGLKMAEVQSADVDRIRENFEVLADPSYIIDVWVEDDEFYERLRETLESGTSMYGPHLGITEHLASVEYLGEHEVAAAEETPTQVDSAVSGGLDAVHLDADTRIQTERSPGFMESDGGSGGFSHRRTSFEDWAFSPDCECITTTAPAARLTPKEGGDDRTVTFA